MCRTRWFTIAAALGMGAVLAIGCATKIVAPPPVDEPPAASSPAGAVQRFAWGFNHQDVEVVGGLLTDDFQFSSAATDSAGNPTTEQRGDRSWFLASLAALRDTSTAYWAIDEKLLPFPDSRPGKNPRFHKQIRTNVLGRLVEINGDLLFFLTRGDSAAIPPELVSRGVRPDSTRWWLDRLEVERLGGGVSYATQASKQNTFGGLLETFHSRVAH